MRDAWPILAINIIDAQMTPRLVLIARLDMFRMQVNSKLPNRNRQPCSHNVQGYISIPSAHTEHGSHESNNLGIPATRRRDQ